MSCIYRSPNTNIDDFLFYYIDFLNKFKGKTLYICGDFNIDLMKYNEHASTSKFLDMLYSFDLYPLVIKPTRITDQSATLIDNIFTNDVNNNMDNYVLIDDITDHLPVATVLTNVDVCKSVHPAV